MHERRVLRKHSDPLVNQTIIRRPRSTRKHAIYTTTRRNSARLFLAAVMAAFRAENFDVARIHGKTLSKYFHGLLRCRGNAEFDYLPRIRFCNHSTCSRISKIMNACGDARAKCGDKRSFYFDGLLTFILLRLLRVYHRRNIFSKCYSCIRNFGDAIIFDILNLHTCHDERHNN